MRRLRPALILTALGLTAAVLIPLQSVAARRDWRIAGLLPLVFHRLAVFLTGTRVETRGPPPTGQPTLVVANHVSWFDIPVLGSLRPLSFIAKSEVAGWPVIGLLAALQRTLFVDRSRRADAAKVNGAVARRLASGEAVALFAEGTTGDGIRIEPFRSPLIEAARLAAAGSAAKCVWLAPLAIRYTRRNGLPLTRREMPCVAWYGDMDLAPHLMALLAGGPLDVRVTWGEPILFDASSDRKRAARAIEAAVRQALL